MPGAMGNDFYKYLNEGDIIMVFVESDELLDPTFLADAVTVNVGGVIFTSLDLTPGHNSDTSNG